MIVLLRGINVGGHNKMPMVALKALLSGLGLSGVLTYIQSGNVLFQVDEDLMPNLDRLIEDSIHQHFGFDVPVILKTKFEFERIFKACPFSEEKKEKCLFVVCSKEPDAEKVKHFMEAQSNVAEELAIVKDCLYVYAEKGIGKMKFNMNAMEKKFGVKATSRNYKTMRKLVSLASITQTND